MKSKTQSASPIRRLYGLLCELESEQAIHDNLMEYSDYMSLRGNLDVRFFEWVYHRIDKRELVEGLLGTVLRRSDVKRLNSLLGKTKIPESEFDNFGPYEKMNQLLKQIGVFVPAVPPPVISGINELEFAVNSIDDILKQLENENSDDHLLDLSSRFPDGIIRRGCERFLKILVFFYSSAGLLDEIHTIFTSGEYGFNKMDIQKEEIVVWLKKKADLGKMNHLLSALNRKIKEEKIVLSGLDYRAGLWSYDIFHKFENIGNNLIQSVHDKGTDLCKRCRSMSKSVQSVLQLVHHEEMKIKTPKSIQFFRFFEDAHGHHYEGYQQDGNKVRFFETSQKYELHRPYLMISAANPSAIDAMCVDFAEWIRDPVL